jgi:RNase P subunit RPR2
LKRRRNNAMSNGERVDIFDEYSAAKRTEEAFNPEIVVANSGHRLLCRTCRAFQRTSIEPVRRDDGHDVLRIKCKTCGASTDFVLRDDASLMPEPWAKRQAAFAKRRMREFLKRPQP